MFCARHFDHPLAFWSAWPCTLPLIRYHLSCFFRVPLSSFSILVFLSETTLFQCDLSATVFISPNDITFKVILVLTAWPEQFGQSTLFFISRTTGITYEEQQVVRCDLSPLVRVPWFSFP